MIDQLLVFERKRSSGRFYFNHKKNTHYYGARQHKDNLVVYSNRKSKLDNAKYCVHIELRFTSSKIIKELGIYTIQDLLAFSHEDIWDQYLDLRAFDYNALGRMSSDVETSLSESSYQRRGKKMTNQYRSTQELLVMAPHYVEALKPIKNRRMFESRLISALN